MADEISLDMAALTLDELSSPAARELLDTIDSLRELHVGEIISLPQIIVVGDQSSGKSSVLEAISRIRFPAKGDTCTRFATELVLRRAPETKVIVTIEPAGPGSYERFDRTSFNKDALPEIIKEATERMGILSDGNRSFSRDVLHVEISGPDVYPVTLVDLPGFFRSRTSSQPQEGKEIVIELAERYMRQPKSIILAVVAASYDLALQAVIDEAKKFDPNGDRTLGVLTKPDRAELGSSEERKSLQVMAGEESLLQLKLGWHVLRNRSESEERLSADERDVEEERFFQARAWSSIAPDSRGSASLRKKLSSVLLGHIQKTLPGVVDEIESGLSTRQHSLDRLGKPRSETEDLRIYLLDIAETFQRLVRDGMEGRYYDEFFGSLYDTGCDTRKLRASLKKLTCAFHATLITKGMDREIVEDDDNEGTPLNDGGFGWIRDGENAPPYLEESIRLFKEFPEPELVSMAEMCKELEMLAAANQGNEFPGLPNGNLGFQLFKMQTQPWGDIAEFYLRKVVESAKNFVDELFVHIIGGDRKTADAVLKLCVVTFF